jgi:hypothetical protein
VVEREASIEILDHKHALDEEDTEKSIKAKKRRVSQAMRQDMTIQLPIATLRENRDSYMSNMIEANAVRVKREEFAFIRARAADYFVYNGALVGVLNDAFRTPIHLLDNKSSGAVAGNIAVSREEDMMREIDMARLAFNGADDGYDEVIMKDDDEAPVFDVCPVFCVSSSCLLTGYLLGCGNGTTPVIRSELAYWLFLSAAMEFTLGRREFDLRI